MIYRFENAVKPGIFSIQLFWRELVYLDVIDDSYKIGDRYLKDILIQLKELEIKSNLPFEIIDGDLLEMPTTLMPKLFEN